jgi:aminoglycoside phosphotransferase (APT) family kinase protein
VSFSHARRDMILSEAAIITLHDMPGCLVTRQSDGAVIKRGRRVNIDEQAALALATQYNLPVPRVYGAGEKNGEPFIRMSFIEGEGLDSVWPRMTVEEKHSICQQLREILTTMRSIPCTTGSIGSCSNGKAHDVRQYSSYDGGPYADEAAFNTELYFDLGDTVPLPIRTALQKQIRSNHRIVFTHGDLAQHNILVKDGQITGLIDWETAGWYPEHWDYIKFFERPCKHRDWKDSAKDIFPQVYDDELAYHQAIIRWQRP